MIKRQNLIHAVFLMVLCLVCVFAKVRATGSDSMGTLLVSQSLLQHGTIKLDNYASILPKYGYRIQEKNNHYYYYFPLGSSLFSIPIVKVANLLGYDMLQYEPPVQMAVVLFVSWAIYFLLFNIAAFYLTPIKSSLVAFIFWLGSSYASTAATALWSHDFAALFALASIYLLLQLQFDIKKARPVLIGFCLFCAYLCRPTLAIFAAIYGLLLVCMQWRLAFKVGAILALLLIGFSLFSMHEFQQWLPDYYLAQRLAGEHFWTALYGNLLSPARGLFIYSPFLMLPVGWLIAQRQTLQKNRILFLLMLWPLLHLIVISRFPHWWAGYSFGPRLMMDTLPAFYLLLVWYLAEFSVLDGWHWQAFLACGAIAIVINTCQGLFNRNTALWSASPSIDEYPEYLFDWRYPQFLSTAHALQERSVAHQNYLRKMEQNPPPELVDAMQTDLRALAALKARSTNELQVQLHENPLTLATEYSFNNSHLYFLGWSQPEALFRWSIGHHSEILFYLAADSGNATSLSLMGAALYQQRIRLSLNDNELGYVEVGPAEQILSINIRPEYLKAGAINTLHFEFAHAKQPPNGDSRRLAFSFRALQLNP